MLARHDAPDRAALAEAAGLDARERGEVAGDERQHARRDHRREPREERNRETDAHQSNRASSSSSRCSVSSSSGGPSSGGRARLHRQTPNATKQSAENDPSERQPPDEEIEALARRRRKDAGAEVLHELVLDLIPGGALVNSHLDVVLDAPRRRRVGLVEGRVAGRTHHLPFERRKRRLRVPARRGRGAGEDECRHQHRDDAHDHDASAACTPRWNASF